MIYTSFIGELNIIKRIESLNGVIHARTSCCDCNEEFKVNWWGHIPINNLQLTIEDAIKLAHTIGDFIGIKLYPMITNNGIGLRFSFYTIVKEEYPTNDNFDLYHHYL